MFHVLFPLVAGVALLFTPVRPKSANETAEQLARRKRILRTIGGVMIALAGAQLFIKAATPKPSAAAMEPQPPLKVPA